MAKIRRSLPIIDDDGLRIDAEYIKKPCCMAALCAGGFFVLWVDQRPEE
jgi:hypothetical protein